jgi:hypothetical protein
MNPDEDCFIAEHTLFVQLFKQKRQTNTQQSVKNAEQMGGVKSRWKKFPSSTRKSVFSFIAALLTHICVAASG